MQVHKELEGVMIPDISRVGVYYSAKEVKGAVRIGNWKHYSSGGSRWRLKDGRTAVLYDIDLDLD